MTARRQAGGIQGSRLYIVGLRDFARCHREHVVDSVGETHGYANICPKTILIVGRLNTKGTTSLKIAWPRIRV